MRCTQSLQNAWSHFFVSGSVTRRLPSVTLADVAEGSANVGARPSQRRISLPGTSSAKHTPQKCVGARVPPRARQSVPAKHADERLVRRARRGNAAGEKRSVVVGVVGDVARLRLF
jgi:hypothetical protein